MTPTTDLLWLLVWLVMGTVTLGCVWAVAKIILDHLAAEWYARGIEEARESSAGYWSDGDFRARWDAMSEGEREAGMDRLLSALRDELPVPYVFSETPLFDQLAVETFERQLGEGRQS